MSDSPAPRRLTGTHVVLAMFMLGISATAFLWFHWNTRMTPFMPLQQALEEEFPNSSPRVEGGVIKQTDETALQVVMRSDFDPRDSSPEVERQLLQRLSRTRELATELADLPNYQVLALHLYYPRKEQGLSQKTMFRSVETDAELDARVRTGRVRPGGTPVVTPDPSTADSAESTSTP